MLIIEGLVFGVVQALSEFLPISSSGHLIILHKIWPSPLLDNLTFDTILHGGTLLAILWFFKKDWIEIIVGLWKSLVSGQSSAMSRLGWTLVVATIPGALAGFFLEHILEQVFRQVWVVALMLVVFALILAWVDKLSRKNQNFESITVSRGWWIGVLQALALIPGVSRSGITTTGGLLFGLTRASAVRFSFLLSAPIIAGAFLKQLLEVSWAALPNQLAWALVVGFLASAGVGYLVIKYLLRFISSNSFKVFIWYRIILAVLLIIFFV
ncbi:MAG: undecaprenyl-diphosphate phosphatase [Candidatus Komeilibacteria bacterium]|nr:undecaprenyl-diphosphate phosphatase [Candidatus Komeilibacteria bacterium]